MENLLSRAVVMRYLRRGMILGICLVLALVICFLPTWRGLYANRFGSWKEGEFAGKRLLELREYLNARKIVLEANGGSTYYAVSGKHLGPNDGVLKFYKGVSFSWFYLGEAHVAVLVVVQGGQGNETIVDLVRYLEVDSL